MTTGFVFSPAPGHDLRNHPESSARLKGLLRFLDERDVLSKMLRLEPLTASEAQVLRVHSPTYVNRLAEFAGRGGGRIDADTYMTKESFASALLAAGGVTALVDAVVTGWVNNGLAVVRPPGHHAGFDRAEGFCLLNHTAIAVRHAQAVHHVARVLVVDFDVHHGNGTQQIFYGDSQVLFVSLHMYASFFYPGMGSLREVGSGSGFGYTINIPFPPGVGDAGYMAAFEQVVRPKAKTFLPELIVVSAGFDAHWRDPLSVSGLSLTGYDALVRALLRLAHEQCDGRILFVLEGGYFREALHGGILNLCSALVGSMAFWDPLGPFPAQETDVELLLAELRQIHLR